MQNWSRNLKNTTAKHAHGMSSTYPILAQKFKKEYRKITVVYRAKKFKSMNEANFFNITKFTSK